MNNCPWGTPKAATQKDQTRPPDFYIGARGSGLVESYTGNIKHLFAYEADLTDQNIADIYADYIANP